MGDRESLIVGILPQCCSFEYKSMGVDCLSHPKQLSVRSTIMSSCHSLIDTEYHRRISEKEIHVKSFVTSTTKNPIDTDQITVIVKSPVTSATDLTNNLTNTNGLIIKD